MNLIKFITFSLIFLFSPVVYADPLEDVNKKLSAENCHYSSDQVTAATDIQCNSGSLKDVVEKIIIPFNSQTGFLTQMNTKYTFRVISSTLDPAVGVQRSREVQNLFQTIISTYALTTTFVRDGTPNNIRLEVFLKNW